MALLDDIKAAVRITDSQTPTAAETARSNDLQGYIDACKDDLKRVGVLEDKIVDTDPRIVHACKLFVMAQINYQGRGDAYMERYRSFRNGTALDLNYIQESDDQDDDQDDDQEEGDV